jgi:hypothetical protein
MKTYQFINQSLRATSYTWSFESPFDSNATNPNNTYTSNTNGRTASLLATNSCITSKISKNLTIKGIKEQANQQNFHSYYDDNTLVLKDLNDAS